MSISYKFNKNPLTTVLTDTLPVELAEQLGSGLGTPLNLFNNRWDMVSGPQKVKQDMYITLATPVGRHLLQPDFGSELPYMEFELYSPILKQEMINTTLAALQTWVPQITNVSVIVDESNLASHYLTLVIRYNIKGTNVLQTLPILLATADNVQLPPNSFTINGLPFLN